MNSRSHLLLLLAAVACAAACGCRRAADLPKTYPVNGQVIRSDGTPLSGGAIYFRCAAHAPLEALAEIGGDGKFQLYTMAEGERCEGAVAGLHEVTVVPPGTPQDIMPAAVRLALPQEVKTQSNDLTIQLPK